jgi:hypothetical protein
MYRPLLAVSTLIFLFSFGRVWAQKAGGLSFEASPTLAFPLGPALSGSGSTSIYGRMGFGATVRGEYALPFAPSLSAGLALDADIQALNGSDKSAQFLGASGELAYSLSLAPRLSLRFALRGGAYGGFFETENFLGPYAAGSLDLDYLLGPSLSIGLGASYKAYFPGVYYGVAASIGLRYKLGVSKNLLKVKPQLNTVFPLFYSYYDKNPVGSLQLGNSGASELRDLAVSFFVPQFMERPKECWSAQALAAGASAEAPIYALFKDSIFSVSEGTKVAGEIVVTYEYLGKQARQGIPVTVEIQNRNGMTWDDTNKAAAFVTSMDGSVREFALPVAAMSRTRGSLALNADFRAAVALFDALKVHGVGYVSDPAAPFETKSTDKDAVDFLQFPVQTLAFKGGDCDDLSILYASLLESAGIASAFVTVPGHIFVAFDLGMGVAEAAGCFAERSSFIDRAGEAWLPVEVTRVQDGFVRAYQTGAQEWLSAAATGVGAFYPIREAWAQFPPANTGELVKAPPSPPPEKTVASAYDAELLRFFASEFQPRVEALKAEIAKGPKAEELSRDRIKLGVLYARFGMLEEARKQFESVAASAAAAPALIAAARVNLGNIAYLGGQYDKAFDYYGRALKIQPDNPVALLGYARAGYEIGKRQETMGALQNLRRIAPASAAEYAYLDSGTLCASRAGSADKEVSSWSDVD